MEITYCTKCRSRVSSVDIRSRKGILTPEGKIYCDSCATELNLYEQYPAEPPQLKQDHSITGQFRAIQAQEGEKSGTGGHRRVRRAGTGKHKTGTGKHRTGTGRHKTGTGTHRRIRRTRSAGEEAPVTETGRIRRRKLQEAAETAKPEANMEPEPLSPEEFMDLREEETKEKNRAPLIIILSLVAAGLLAAVIIVMVNRSSKTEDRGPKTENSVQQPEDTEKEETAEKTKEKNTDVKPDKDGSPDTAEKVKPEPDEPDKPEKDDTPAIQDKIADIPAPPAKKYLEADGWTSLLGDWKKNLTPLRGEWDSGINTLRTTVVKGEPSPFIETAQTYGDHKAAFTFAASGNVNFEFMFGKEGDTGGLCLIRVPEPGVWHTLTWEVKAKEVVSAQMDGKDILSEPSPRLKVYPQGMKKTGSISVGITPYDRTNVLSVSFSEIALAGTSKTEAETAEKEGDAPAAESAMAGIWIEGENPSSSNVIKHKWYDAGNRELMSGNDWITHYSDDDTTAGTVTYTFKCKGASYRFWLRANVAGTKPFYRIDGSDWKEIDLSKKQDTVNVSPKTDHRVLGWIDMGNVDLKEGEHTVEFKFDGGVRKSGAIDCFTFTTDQSYSPSGTTKPSDAGGPTEVVKEKPKPIETKPIADKPLGDEVQGMLFGDDFENWDGDTGLWDSESVNNGKLSRSDKAAFSGKQSLCSEITGDKGSAMLISKFKPATSCYVRMKMYLQPGWDSTFQNEDDNAFFLRVKTASDKGVYAYVRKQKDHHEICAQAHSDDNKWPGSYINGTVTPGQWMYIEIYCPPTGSDMEFKFFINKREAKFKASMVGLGPWEKLEIGWGAVKAGARPVCYIDDVIVSTEYIGPDKSVGEVLTAKTDWQDSLSEDFEGSRPEGSKYITERRYKIDRQSAKAPKADRGDPFELKGIVGIPEPAPISKNSRILVSYYTTSSKIEILFIGKDGDGNPFEAVVRPDPTVKENWTNLELLVFDIEIRKGKLSDSVKIDTVVFQGGTEDEKRPALYIDNLKIQN